MSADSQIGVYICHCGHNIKDTIDLEKVKKVVSRLDDVKIVETIELPFGVKNVEVEVIANNIKEIEIEQKIRPAPVHLPLITIENNIDVKVESVKDETVYLSKEMFPSTWYKSFIRCGLNSKNQDGGILRIN